MEKQKHWIALKIMIVGARTKKGLWALVVDISLKNSISILRHLYQWLK